VRYQHTAIAADFDQGPMGEIPDYNVLVPNVNVLRKLSNGNVLKLAYNRRIQRPSLQFLSPNLQAANPLIQTQGNPALGPERTNNYELSYSTLLKQANLSSLPSRATPAAPSNRYARHWTPPTTPARYASPTPTWARKTPTVAVRLPAWTRAPSSA